MKRRSFFAVVFAPLLARLGIGEARVGPPSRAVVQAGGFLHRNGDGIRLAQNLVFHKKVFSLTMADHELPEDLVLSPLLSIRAKQRQYNSWLSAQAETLKVRRHNQ